MGFSSVSFDPQDILDNSDAASSALAEALSASDAASSALIAAGKVYAGSATFNGTTGVTVSIGESLSGSAYAVAVLPRGSNIEDVGPIGVCQKSTTQFVVKNLGAETAVDFDWILRDLN